MSDNYSSNKDLKLKKRKRKAFVVIVLIVVLFLIFKIVCMMLGDFGEILDGIVVFSIFPILFAVLLFKSKKESDHLEDLRAGRLLYPPVTIGHDRFVNECKNELPPSYIRIDGEIYRIATRMELYGQEPEFFVCYIDREVFKGVDTFLEYRIGDKYSLNELAEVEFLECNGGDPSVYLVEHKF